DASANAGFTTGEPWLPLGDDHAVVNVAAERDDPASMLTLHRRLIQLRHREPALHRGDWRPVPRAEDVLVYERTWRDSRFLVALNFGSQPAAFTLPADAPAGAVAIGTTPGREGERVEGELRLAGDEGVVVRLG
ncbi:MAG TPA: DUF3459 domain-containing protein, partial [Gemmatimonadaceae bacterium]|nr:DUF3459 domain-containing protein [Gemmatimonadaceae bacterium]